MAIWKSTETTHNSLQYLLYSVISFTQKYFIGIDQHPAMTSERSKTGTGCKNMVTTQMFVGKLTVKILIYISLAMKVVRLTLIIHIIAERIRIFYEFVDRRDKSVPRVTVWYHEPLPSDAKQ